MKKPGLILGMVIILAMALGMGWRRSEGNFSGDDVASLVAVGVMVTLMSSFVLARFRGNLTGAMRDLMIWGMIVAGVTLAYANKASFGF